MNSRERIVITLQHREPDRVPHFEWSVNSQVREALAPGCKTYSEFAVRMGYDAVLVEPHFEREPAGAGRWRSEWGYVLWYGIEDAGIEVECPVQSLTDLERYSPPDLHLPSRYAALENAVREFKGKKAIGVNLHDVFSIPRRLMGMENMLVAFAEDPELIRALVELSVNLNLEMAKEVAARGADFVWTSDDYAGNTGPFMSPLHFRELLYPGLCRVVRGFKELGLYVIKHTDGNLWSIIDMLVDSGIDCLDPIDPQAGMDLGEVKAKYGKRIAIKGNIDCARTLTLCSKEQVIAETKEALRQGAPGGGYILSSSNSLYSGVKPENYTAMLQTLDKFGRYPLSL